MTADARFSITESQNKSEGQDFQIIMEIILDMFVSKIRLLNLFEPQI